MERKIFPHRLIQEWELIAAGSMNPHPKNKLLMMV